MSKPTAIQFSRKREVLVLPWDDGHVSTYSFAYLRAACPCVECRGGHENMGETPNVDDLLAGITLAAAQSHDLVNLVPVGLYGLQPEWSDGHHTGLFTWPYLRAICPCPICKP